MFDNVTDYTVAEAVCVQFGGTCVLQECCPHNNYVTNQCTVKGHVCCLYKVDCQWKQKQGNSLY